MNKLILQSWSNQVLLQIRNSVNYFIGQTCLLNYNKLKQTKPNKELGTTKLQLILL